MGRRVDAFRAHVSLNRACLSRTRTRSRRLTFGIVYNEKDATCQAHYSTGTENICAGDTFVRVYTVNGYTVKHVLQARKIPEIMITSFKAHQITQR